jgi:hypothetical protein
VQYKLYRLSAANRVKAPPIILDCADDIEAIREAGKYLEGGSVELWNGNKLIKKLESNS